MYLFPSDRTFTLAPAAGSHRGGVAEAHAPGMPAAPARSQKPASIQNTGSVIRESPPGDGYIYGRRPRVRGRARRMYLSP